jgi:hypothetical protein
MVKEAMRYFRKVRRREVEVICVGTCSEISTSPEAPKFRNAVLTVMRDIHKVSIQFNLFMFHNIHNRLGLQAR